MSQATDGMLKSTAESLIEEKLKELDSCPFCGKTPIIEAYCCTSPTHHGHYSIRKPCCRVMGAGATELFFTPIYEAPNYGLWLSMVRWMVDEWNDRRT